jgi:hypothetical protein
VEGYFGRITVGSPCPAEFQFTLRAIVELLNAQPKLNVKISSLEGAD